MSGRRGPRRRVAPSIYADQYGLAAVLIVHGHREETRFPHGTPISTVRRQLEVRRVQLEADVGEAPARGTVAQLVADYLTGLQPGRFADDRRALLQAWVMAVGQRPMLALTHAELVRVLDGWAAAGHSASRQNKRLSALRALWRRVAPASTVPHPLERLTRRPEPKAARDRALDVALVERVLAAVSDVSVAPRRGARDQPSRSRARLRALFWTGQPAALLSQVRPSDVRWEADPPELYVQPRRKGAGVDAAWVPLVPPAVAALRHLFAIKAHGGDWHRGVLRQAWRRAVKVVQAELRAAGQHDDASRLETSRVYDLRHSFLTALAKASGDLYAVAEAARHSDLQTTRRYLHGASSARLKAGMAALTAILPGLPLEAANGEGRNVERKRDSARKGAKSRTQKRPSESA